MKDCDNFQTIIQAYVAGEIPPSDLEALREHCKQCLDCRALLDMHIEMSELGESVPEPDAAAFASMRDKVMDRLASQLRTQTASRPQTGHKEQKKWNWGTLFGLRPALAVPAMVVIIVAAVLAGRMTAPAAELDQAGPLSDDIMIQAVQRQAVLQQASSSQDMDSYWDSPFTYSNVAVRPVEGGNIDLSFDVSRHVSLTTPANSPVAKEVLLQAILSPAPLGKRMKAMQMAPVIMDPKLEAALVYTMHRDPDLAVRLEALNILTRFPYNDSVQQALLTTLRQDESVQMRLLALEKLADKQVQMETIEQAIDAGNLESDPAVRQHAIQLLNGAIDEQTP